MIIVEGPDGAGKSVLIEQLGLTPVKYRALRAGEGGTALDGTCAPTDAGWGGSDEATVAYAKAIMRHGPEIALDRFHLSERVYGPMLRGGAGISYDEVTLLHRFTQARAVPIVICMPPFTTTLANVTRPGRERPRFQSTEFLDDAYVRWEQVVEHYVDELHVARVYNYTEDSVDALRADLATVKGLPDGVVGSPTAKFLFVGDRANRIDLPYFTLGGWSRDLFQAIIEAGFDEREIAITSVSRSDGTQREIVLPPSVTTVLALGRHAADHMSSFAAQVDVNCFPQMWCHPYGGQAFVARLEAIRLATS